MFVRFGVVDVPAPAKAVPRLPVVEVLVVEVPVVLFVPVVVLMLALACTRLLNGPVSEPTPVLMSTTTAASVVSIEAGIVAVLNVEF